MLNFTVEYRAAGREALGKVMALDHSLSGNRWR